jgi:DNA invertase Pin-like site-specific DNA recombinase
MMTRIRKGGIHAVLVAKLDRLGRSLPHLIQIVAELDSLGVGLIVPSQGIDTSTNNPAGRLQLNVLAAVAEFEREIIRDRTRAGLAVARAKGKRLGRPPVTADLPEGWASMSVRELARAMGVSTGKAQAVRRAALAAGVA